MPAFGIIASTALASLAVVISYLGANGATVFTTLVLMTGITAAVPVRLLRSGPAEVAHPTDHQTVETPRFVRDVVRGRCRRWCSRVAVHLLLAQHRATASGTSYWGPFLLAGGAAAARHPGLPRAAQAA